jgi:hypothetical protein
MKKKIVAVSFFCMMVVILVCFTPALASKVITPSISSAAIPIQITRYMGKNPVRTIALVSPTDASQIKQCLIDLYQAQESNDHTTIAKCIVVLKSYGIVLDKKDQALMSPQNNIPQFSKTLLPGFTCSATQDNISNTVCFFNAIGQGMMYGSFALKFLQEVAKVLQNQTNLFSVIILLIVLLPLIVTVLLFNDLIPIRILMPVGVLVLANGTVSSIGLLGVKHMNVGAAPIGANLNWFTGLTINIPRLNNESKPFVFVSGFALKVGAETGAS